MASESCVVPEDWRSAIIVEERGLNVRTIEV